MSAFENNAKAFTDAIRKMAKEKCDEINSETQFIKSQRIQTFTDDAKARCDSLIKYEIDRINADKNRSVSLTREKSKKELSDLRAELTKKVFDSAFKQIEEYTSSEKYEEYLVTAFKEIYDCASEDTVYYISEKDSKYIPAVSNAVSENLNIKESSEILLGGVKAIDTNNGCLYDNTLDVKFEEQKEWFFENSGLKI